MSKAGSIVALSLLLIPPFAAAQSRTSDAPNVRARRAVANGPMRFEVNRGQTDPRVRFLARGNGYTLFLTDQEAVFSLDAERGRSALRLSLVGAQPPRSIVGAEPLPGKTHYLRGSDSRRWTTDVPSFAKVRYEDVYRGIDLVYYGNQQQLEYDYVVAPGADPAAIRVRFAGAERMTIAAQGDLLLRVAQHDVRQLRPVAYQRSGSVRREIPVRYELAADGAVGFSLGEYDSTVPVVIDPVLIYSTYLGGSGESSGAQATAADSSGAAYVAGFTASTDFPTTSGAFRETHNGGDVFCFCDAFVTKFDANGAVVYSTFVGGHGGNRISGIAVGPAGEAYIAGGTTATDFPTTNGAFQRTCAVYGPGSDGLEGQCGAGFVAKLDSAGAGLAFSTYLGGWGVNLGGHGSSVTAIALDPALNILLAGITGPEFPISAGAFQPQLKNGYSGTFVAKMNADGRALLYSSYFGGSSVDTPLGIVTDRSGNAYITGAAQSADFPTTPGAFQSTCSPRPVIRLCYTGFVMKVSANGTSMAYSTLLPVFGVGRGIAVDQYGFAYVTGDTKTSAFPEAWDAFVTKLNLDGTGAVYWTTLGGDVPPPGAIPYETGSGIEVDAVGNAYIVGSTSTIDFPQVDSLQPVFGGGTSDAFAAVLNASGSALTFSTYLGGSGDEQATGLALDAHGDLLAVGRTQSLDFPVINAAQPVSPGTPPENQASFVAKIGGLSSCGTEVTGQVDIRRTAFLPIFWPFNLQLAIVWNRGAAPVNAPLAYVMDDLQNAVFVGPSRTRCFSPDGDPLTMVPLTGDQVLAPNEARLLGLWFYQTQLAAITYAPRLIAGPRNR